MNWMLLPPSANTGRHIEDGDVSDGNVWTNHLHAGIDFCRKVVAGSGTAEASQDPPESAPPKQR